MQMGHTLVMEETSSKPNVCIERPTFMHHKLRAYSYDLHEYGWHAMNISLDDGEHLAFCHIITMDCTQTMRSRSNSMLLTFSISLSIFSSFPTANLANNNCSAWKTLKEATIPTIICTKATDLSLCVLLCWHNQFNFAAIAIAPNHKSIDKIQSYLCVFFTTQVSD